jgi:hypothetical protein
MHIAELPLVSPEHLNGDCSNHNRHTCRLSGALLHLSHSRPVTSSVSVEGVPRYYCEKSAQLATNTFQAIDGTHKTYSSRLTTSGSAKIK